MNETVEVAHGHPAKWNLEVLDRMLPILRRWLPGSVSAARVLDPYGGVGTIHYLRAYNLDTVSIEREAAYVALGRQMFPDVPTDRMLVGDAADVGALRVLGLGPFDAIITSPSWGNRMADRYLGENDVAAGRKPPHESRMTYATSLGYIPDEGSTAVLPWGREYRAISLSHMQAWASVLADNAVVIVDIADHTRQHQRQHVVDWWGAKMRETFGRVEEKIGVNAPRYGHGANRNARWPEMLLVAVKRPS